MYNKLFTKILDSSIWLEPTPTRIIWITMLAAMDETGYVQFASVPNLAHRAVVSLKEAQEAVTILENPDPNSSDQDHEGRRIEKVPGGWMILNAPKYRDLAKRVHIQEQTRERVRKFRADKASGNASVTKRNEIETLSEADTDTGTATEAATKRQRVRAKAPDGFSDEAGRFAEWFRTTLPETLNLNRNWKATWAKAYDDMILLDNRTKEQIFAVCRWARNDERFWKRNFYSPTKLRQRNPSQILYFDKFDEEMKAPTSPGAIRMAEKRKGENQENINPTVWDPTQEEA